MCNLPRKIRLSWYIQRSVIAWFLTDTWEFGGHMGALTYFIDVCNRLWYALLVLKDIV